MRVLLTGGTGNVGVAAVARLVEAGHAVTVIGRSPDKSLPGAAYVRCDINDFDSLLDVTRGHDAVVHLAAIPHPVGYPGREVFRVNDLGTFNVFEAAAEAGISRVVGASSINAVGYYFGDRGPPIGYVPIDELHPVLATDAYSFSKQVMEDIGRYFWERDRISSVMLRLPSVRAHDKVTGGVPTQRYDTGLLRKLLDLPAERRDAEVARLHAAYARYRRAHRSDKSATNDWWREPDPGGWLTPDELHLMHHTANFFAYVDELDSAEAIVLGLTAGYEGSHPLFINARRNSLGLPLAEIAPLYGPPTPPVRTGRPGDDTVVSIERARELIGFEPKWELPVAVGGP